MTKFNNKGFFLTETIVVIGIVATVLVFLYGQISFFYQNYERNAKYNTVEAIHAVRNIKKFIVENDYTTSLVTSLGTNTMIDITNYSFDATGFYPALITAIDADKVYFMSYTGPSELILNHNDLDASFLDYLKTLNSGTKPDNYRIIIKLNNGNYASLYYQDL